MRICVYCSSSSKIDKAYFDATGRLAKEFIKNNIEVIYGGGAVGLMGKLADTILESNGKIKGIMPKFMNEIEWAHKKVKDLEFTETMHQRKAKFLENIDAVVALPGGTGTLEELLETITLKRLGQFTKPIVILNTNRFYDPLKAMLKKCIDEKFMHERHIDMWSFAEEPEEVLEKIKSSPEWHKNAIEFASNR